MSSETASDAATGTTEGSTPSARRIIGRVVSNKMEKGVSVAIERLVRHSAYSKYIRRTSKVLAHDEDNACKEGDTVAIVECRPISKRKSWRVVEIVQSADAS